MKYEILQMQKRNCGIIVNMSSVHGLRGNRKNMSAYTASKFGIVGLTQTAALEYKNKGIVINSICPGAIRTPMQERLKASQEQLKRMSPPEDIASLITWLFSDSSLRKTGQALTDRQWKRLMQKNSSNKTID
jgi:NAD(P)-dependent dehydrogenase (short-subunit alcohol dehydrogenase family)